MRRNADAVRMAVAREKRTRDDMLLSKGCRVPVRKSMMICNASDS